ncbi:hypothetical protein [Candidatus Methylocalor cossyra]|uniref:Polymerase nucleotidyl transferase domain-containing protein n=1 Tax=Candidatus Methylocalor cossyra TaxID=3108543 RepID=A0ABM9NER8_9GAMM
MNPLPRDFVETPEGWLFAVVDRQPEDGRILTWLRYVPAPEGRLTKLGTEAAESFLAQRGPGYRFWSRRLDAPLHGVPLDRVRRHYRPRDRVQALLRQGPRDGLEDKALHLLQLLMEGGIAAERLGLTGSLLIGAHRPESDLDLVIYGRATFDAARHLVGQAIAAGRLDALDLAAWRETYRRRGCALGFEDYLWHEQRKRDKGRLAGTKFDLTLVGDDPPPESGPVRKLGPKVLRARVRDADLAFDVPARYRLDHAEVEEALSLTQTYAGQAEAGETVEIAGCLEDTADGQRRIVVGSSREAPGQYIRVLR